MKIPPLAGYFPSNILNILTIRNVYFTFSILFHLVRPSFPFMSALLFFLSHFTSPTGDYCNFSMHREPFPGSVHVRILDDAAASRWSQRRQWNINKKVFVSRAHQLVTAIHCTAPTLLQWKTHMSVSLLLLFSFFSVIRIRRNA